LKKNESPGTVRLRSWDEFKRLATELKTNVVVYNIEQSIPARELTSLRLILPGQGVQYLLIDFPRGDKLKETGISLHKDKKGNYYLKDEDVVRFVKSQLGKEDLIVCSYWTI